MCQNMERKRMIKIVWKYDANFKAEVLILVDDSESIANIFQALGEI
jgi:hypothetical protein